MNETIQKLVDELSELLVQDLWKLILTALRRQLARMEIRKLGVSAPTADSKRLAVANNGLPTPKPRRGRPRGRGIPKAHIKVMVRCIQAEKVRAFEQNRELLQSNVIDAFRSKLPTAVAESVFESLREEWQKAVDGRLKIQALTAAINGASGSSQGKSSAVSTSNALSGNKTRQNRLICGFRIFRDRS
jgi:hypothetical protein